MQCHKSIPMADFCKVNISTGVFTSFSTTTDQHFTGTIKSIFSLITENTEKIKYRKNKNMYMYLINMHTDCKRRKDSLRLMIQFQ